MAENLFKNPIGWAENTIGTKMRYISYILLTIWLGFAVIFLILVLPDEYDIAISGLVFFGAIVLPLCYLKALRAMVVERKKDKEIG